MAEWTLDRLMDGAHRHPEDEVLEWAKRLRYFHFMGEVSSGQMEHYEELQMRLRFDGHDDLIHLLAGLGLLRPGDGESRVPEHPDLVQPGHGTIAGSKCRSWVEYGFIDITCSADRHVSESNVGDAIRIEARIDTLQ